MPSSCIMNNVDLQIFQLIKSLACRDLDSVRFSLSVSDINAMIEFTRIAQTSGNDRDVRPYSLSSCRQCLGVECEHNQLQWHNRNTTLGCCNIAYPSETHNILKRHGISFAYNLFIICKLVLNVCKVLCSELFRTFQNESTKYSSVIDELDFARFEFLRDILYYNSLLASELKRYVSYLSLWDLYTYTISRVLYTLYQRVWFYL